MGTNADKHARQKENRGGGAVASSGRPRGLWIGLAMLIAVVVAGGVFLLTNSGDDGGSADGDADTTTTTQASAGADLPPPPEGITLSQDTPCPPADGTEKRVQKFAGPPPLCIDAATTNYSASFDTTEGTFSAVLAADNSPNTVNNFVVLSRYGYYTGVPFHRVVADFVIQAGDGDGEPWGNNDLGYTLGDELPTNENPYPDYSLAMANSGPDTNGSQFFVILPGGGAALNPDFSPFGQVTEGQEVVDAIGKLGAVDQSPTKAVLINSVTISETPKG